MDESVMMGHGLHPVYTHGYTFGGPICKEVEFDVHWYLVCSCIIESIANECHGNEKQQQCLMCIQ